MSKRLALVLEGLVQAFLVLFAITFLLLAAWLLYHAISALFIHTAIQLPEMPNSSSTVSVSTKTITAISDLLLAVIMVELAETVRSQLAELTDPTSHIDPWYQLVSNLLATGVVAGVRHLLAISAVLTLSAASSSATNHGSLVLEFGLTGVVVLALTWSWLFTRGHLKGIEAR